jgi:transposase
MRGKKGERHAFPDDPPRRRGNRAKGHGTYATDRPPVWGLVGRLSGAVRLRVLSRADAATLHPLVETLSQPEATLHSDTWNGYNGVARQRLTVDHGRNEWARDADGDGLREVHINTLEGLWMHLRSFLRPFRGVHKKLLAGYVAVFELVHNAKRIFPALIAPLVRFHGVWT